MKGRVVVALAAVTALFAVSVAWAGDEVLSQRKSLAGVRAFSVVVEETGSELTDAGLSRETIQSGVGLRLRALGIHVVGEDQLPQLPGMPYLHVAVVGYKNETSTGVMLGYITHVNIEFLQGVRLERAPSVSIYGATWEMGALYTRNTVAGAREGVLEVTDRFANAYLAANPK